MNIDKENFEAWMLRILDRLDRIEENFKQKASRNLLEGEKLLDTADLIQLLQVTSRTLRRYRNLGILPFLFVNGRCYYREKDIHDLIRKKLNEKRQSKNNK